MQQQDPSHTSRPPNPLLTRRAFIGALLGASAATTAGSAALLSGCSSSVKDASTELESKVSQEAADDASINTLKVSEDQVVQSTGFDEALFTDYLTQQATYDLPYGTLLFMSSPNHCAALTPGGEGGALIRLGFLTIATGQMSILMERAQGHDEGFVIYDARLSDEAAIWVECNMSTGDWRVFFAEVAAEALVTPTKVDEGRVEYDPPLLCVSANKAYWTVMPDPNGPLSSEDSLLKSVSVATSGAITGVQVVHTSHGRMITNPQASEGILTFVPRVDTNNVYYQITALEVQNDRRRAVSILPQSMRVSDAVYLGTGFAFCTEDNYDYAAGLAYFGTYLQLPDGRYLHVSREPSCPPLMLGNLLVVKSTRSIVGIDTAASRFFAIDTLPNCADYGDILAACGKQDRIVAYTTVPAEDEQLPGVVRVRVFAPIA